MLKKWMKGGDFFRIYIKKLKLVSLILEFGKKFEKLKLTR